MPPAAERLLAAQAGVISRQQALGCGVSAAHTRRLLDEGRWRNLTVGIYTEGDPSWRANAWAGVLLGGSHSVLGLHAAAHALRLEQEPPETISIWIGQNNKRLDCEPWEFIRGERLGVGDLPAYTR